jgi:putative intracellular protease/amidase
MHGRRQLIAAICTFCVFVLKVALLNGYQATFCPDFMGQFPFCPFEKVAANSHI